MSLHTKNNRLIRIVIGFNLLIAFLFIIGSSMIYAAGESPPPPPSDTLTPPPPPTITVTSTPEYSSSGSNSGSGGGGSTSDEAFTNIEIREKYEQDISKNIVTSYRFTTPGNIIMFVNITGNSSKSDINVAVEVLKNTSSLVKNSAPGKVYKNINLWVGTSGYAVPQNIKNAEIKFKIDNSWMNSNDFESVDIKMMRWDGSTWKVLETKEYSKDSTYSYFAVNTNSFSPFVIAGIKNEVMATFTSTVPGSPVQTGTEASPGMTPKSSGFEVVIVLIALPLVYILSEKRR